MQKLDQTIVYCGQILEIEYGFKYVVAYRAIEIYRFFYFHSTSIVGVLNTEIPGSDTCTD